MQNLRFSGDPPADEEFPHPPGAAIARLLGAGIQEQGWDTRKFDNWRDVGWSIRCLRGKVELELAFSAMDTTEWALQIAPAHVPGVVGRWRGKRPSAEPSDCFELATAVHRVLSNARSYRGFQWCWDDMPDETNSTTEPDGPRGSS